MNILDNEGLEYYNERLIAYLKSLSAPAVAGVSSFNGRSGDVTPQSGDYTASDVGAVPTSRTVNNKVLTSDIVLTADDVNALSISGTAMSATKLATSRTIRTNLASTTATSFDGTSNITPGVIGILPISNGGTGATTASSAMYNIVSPLTSRTKTNLETYASSTYIPCYYSTTGYKVSLESLKETISGSSIRILMYGTGTTSMMTFNVTGNVSSDSFIFAVTKYSYYCYSLIGSFKNNLGSISDTEGSSEKIELAFSNGTVTITGSTMLNRFNSASNIISFLII